jgi:hypothetical protein
VLAAERAAVGGRLAVLGTANGPPARLYAAPSDAPGGHGRIVARLKPGGRVLDVGGWAAPFRPATPVLDLMPFETRGAMGELSRAAKAGYVEVPAVFAELILEGSLPARERVVIGPFPTDELAAKVRARFRPTRREPAVKEARERARHLAARAKLPLRRAVERAI